MAINRSPDGVVPIRGVAQPGRALRSGRRGRRFKSSHPDQVKVDKVESTNSLQQFFSQQRLKEVFTPIGIPIGAESPEEIALSIVSELICVRRKGDLQARALRAVVGMDS